MNCWKTLFLFSFSWIARYQLSPTAFILGPHKLSCPQNARNDYTASLLFSSHSTSRFMCEEHNMQMDCVNEQYLESSQFNPPTLHPQKNFACVLTQLESNSSWINTSQQVEQACVILKECSRIAVDIEGIDLGRFGKICIIQIATEKNEIFLFDICTLAYDAFRAGLRAILESPTIQKIMFDCRSDCDALYYQYDVQVKTVVDAQIAIMCNKRHNKKTRLIGLKQALIESNVIPYDRIHQIQQIKDKGLQLFRGSYKVWKIRPLPLELMKYCCVDILYLLALYDSNVRILQKSLTSTDIERMSQMRADYHVHLSHPIQQSNRSFRDF